MKTLACLLILLLLPLPAWADYWQQDTPILCQEDLPGCRILQMAMRGDFDGMDLKDSLNSRMLAAALPWLQSITAEDMAHFHSYFPQVGEEALLQNYHRALGNCLLSHIRQGEGEFTAAQQQARSVLHLFLDPHSQAEGLKNRAYIRSKATDEFVHTLAREGQVPVSFAEYLVYTDGYQAETKIIP